MSRWYLLGGVFGPKCQYTGSTAKSCATCGKSVKYCTTHQELEGNEGCTTWNGKHS